MQGDSPRSQLFSVRLWPEALSDGVVEWRGKVQHVLSGEAHYFRQWSELVDHLNAMVAAHGQPPATADPRALSEEEHSDGDDQE